MIISHAKKFIFIHIPKCAGTSIRQKIESYFNKNGMLAIEDLISFRVGYDELPILGTSANREIIHDYTEDQLRLYQEFHQHSTFSLVESVFNREKINLDEYFKFAFCRNPWDRKVSQYFFGRQQAEKGHEWAVVNKKLQKPFKDFASGADNWGDFRDGQHQWVLDKEGKLGLDFIGKSENLQEDFNYVCEKIGLPQMELPHSNKSKHKHYTEYYDEEAKNLFDKNYSKDIEFFNYKFGE